MTRVLVVEDEPAIVESLVYLLEKDAFEVESAGTLDQARAISSGKRIDVVILDLMLPDGSGFELIAELRRSEAMPAIVVLSSRDGETDRVKALEMGADDYVTKPFSPREVVARVRAVLRRLSPAQSKSEPSLVVNKVARRCHFQGRELDLTKIEFELLALFSSSPGRAYSRADILEGVWGKDFALSDRTIDSHIKSLRRKLTEAGAQTELIETVRGIGYRLSSEGQAP